MTTLKYPGAYLFVLVQFEDPVLKKIIKSLLLFVYISGLECIFFDSLSDFYANIFFYAYRVLQTNYFVFSGFANIFFQYFSSPPPPEK